MGSTGSERFRAAELWSEALPEVMACVTIDALVEVDRLNTRRTAVVEGDPTGDSRGLGQDELCSACPQDRADLLQDVHTHRRRLEVGRAHGLAEVVQVLQGQEADTKARVPLEGHDNQGRDDHEREGRPRIEPGGIDERECEAKARSREHGVDRQQDDAGPLLRPLTAERRDASQRQGNHGFIGQRRLRPRRPSRGG